MEAVPLSEIDPVLAARVANDATHHFKLDGLPALTAAWAIRNPYSLVLRLELTRGDWSCRFFAKLAKGPHVSKTALREQLKTEYEVLMRLTAAAVPAATATAPAASVVPLAFYSDLPSLVTIEAQGWTLRKVYAQHARVWGRKACRQRLLASVQLCGSWLAEFHRLTAVGSGDFEITALLDYCRVRLHKLQSLHPGVLSPQEVLAIEAAAQGLSTRLVPGTLRLAGRHNDFASHNIIASPKGGIRVLDFQSFDVGASAFDVCNFWFELELLKFDPSYSAQLLTQMQRAFLAAYGPISTDQPDFQLARLRYAINRLLNELDGAKGLRRLSPRWRRCVKGTRAWLLAFAASRPMLDPVA